MADVVGSGDGDGVSVRARVVETVVVRGAWRPACPAGRRSVTRAGSADVARDAVGARRA